MIEKQTESLEIAEHAALPEATNDACESTAKAANPEVPMESLPEHRRGVRLTVERELLAEWLALTAAERSERGLAPTQREFAEKLCVSECSLSRFKAEPEFQRDMSRRLRARCQERAPSVIAKMAEVAEGGDVSAGRLIMERAMPEEKPGTFVSVPVTVSTAVLVGQADEDAPLPEWYKEQRRQQGAVDNEIPAE